MARSGKGFTLTLGLVLGTFCFTRPGVAQTVTVDPPTHDFGSSTLGRAIVNDFEFLFLSIKSNATQVAHISWAATGDTGDFSVLEAANGVGCEPSHTLLPGACSSLFVFFKPQLLGPRLLTITITSDVSAAPVTAT